MYSLEYHSRYEQSIITHLIVLRYERLPRRDGGGAIHFEAGVSIFPDKHLQDLQHLCVWEKWFQTEH